MQAIDALLQRRSARALKEPAPDGAMLELILEIAARAPDHGRLRPWSFIVIRGPGRARFGELLAEHLRRTNGSATADSLQRERDKAFRAPVIIVVTAICNTFVKVPAIEQVLAAGAAAQNIMLAAFALGFNAMWKTGAPAYDEAAKKALGLESKDAVVGFIYLGTDVEGSGALQRQPPHYRVQYWDK
jgi:nitroreductase